MYVYEVRVLHEGSQVESLGFYRQRERAEQSASRLREQVDSRYYRVVVASVFVE